MADISFYKYLEAAFRHKLFKDKAATSFKYLSWNLPYNRIFYYARRVLPKFYGNEFPNTEEGNLQMAKIMLEKLDRHQDLELERYFNPATVPLETEQPVPQATMASVAAGETPTTMGGGRLPALPHLPTPIPLTNIRQSFASRSGIFFQRNVGKYFTVGRIATGISMGIGAIAGSILGPVGTFAGAGVGALMPSFIRSGGGRFLGNIGNGAINAGLGISNQISTGSLIKLPPKKFWAFIGLFFLLIGVGIFSAVFNPPGEEQPTAEAAPVGASLTSCQFTRGDQNPPSAAYQSSVLLGYFQEAAAKSGVPAVVLAAVARVESPGIVNQTNGSLPSYGCPTSPTGAKGLMQIQPPGTTGHSAAGVSLGAQYLGIPVDQIDYCDIRQSIYLGAGVINAKRSGGKWDPSQNNNKSYIDSVAETYYGCLRYPSCTQGPYSYGDDLWASLQNCRTSDLAAIQPPGFVYYCQGNIAWQQCSLGKAGCGPTSLAMVLSSFGINLTPPQVDQIFQDNGWRSCGDSPTRLAAVLQSLWLKDLGFEVGSNLIRGSSLDPSQAKAYLDGGYLIIASSHNYPCANCTAVGKLVDHIFVVDAVDLSSNTVDIRDPNNCSYANGNDENQSNRVKSINSFAWLYAYPIKKVR